jgi:hypothetical protein
MMLPPLLQASSSRVPLALVFVGAMTVGIGLLAAPERTWLNLLVGGFYLVSLASSAMFFASSQLLSGARWSAGLRRVPEALMLLLPVAAFIMLALFAGRGVIYSDAANASVHAIGGRTLYLKSPFVFARLVSALAAFGAFAWLFRSTSLAQDGDRRTSVSQHRKLVRCAAVFVVVFAPAFTALSYDWLLCLEQRWFSTMFAVYAFAGAFVQVIAAITIVVVLLLRQGRLDGVVDRSQLHDLGKLLFAFSTFWAYIWLCQYLLIWYGDVPEEVVYYVHRTGGPWLVLFALNFVVNWLVPFVVLMSARAKRSPRVLGAVSALVLAGRWLDLYVMVMPSRWSGPRFGVIEIAVIAACGSLAYLVLLHGLSRAPLVPMHDPLLAADGHGHA